MGLIDETEFGTLTTRTFSGAQRLNELTIQRHGISWTVKTDKGIPRNGVFANGDPWVVGPVEIVKINPPHINVEGRDTNGSMVNPNAGLGMRQGYDAAMFGQYRSSGDYDRSLNVSAQLSGGRRLVLYPYESLISTRSRTAPGVRPQILNAAVLTVLDDVPAANSFRPAWADGEKVVRWTTSDITWSVLGSGGTVPGLMTAAAGYPELDIMERWLEGVWLDHVPNWTTRYLAPVANMRDYSREQADQYGTATLALNTDQWTQSQKTTLMVHAIQRGIDAWGLVQGQGGVRQLISTIGQRYNATPWVAGDGQSNGRFWRILFAGLMLQDPDMLGVGGKTGGAFDYAFQGENGQTFYVAETPTGSGVYNYGLGGYTAGDVGVAEWGPKHLTKPHADSKSLTASSYRGCCTASSWWAQALSCLAMGGKADWNHDAFFDYLTRYRDTILPALGAIGTGRPTQYWTQWPWDMFEANRTNYSI